MPISNGQIQYKVVSCVNSWDMELFVYPLVEPCFLKGSVYKTKGKAKYLLLRLQTRQQPAFYVNYTQYVSLLLRSCDI